MTKSKKNVLIAIALIFTGFGAQCAIVLPICRKAPIVDGKLNDKCWTKASKIKEFKIFRRGPIGSITNDTEVFLTRDNKWLYLAFKCHNVNMQHVESQGTAHDEVANYKDDSVEILFGRQGTGYFFSYILTCDNMKGEQRIARNSAVGWDMPWASATQKSDKGWTAEVALPLFIVNSSTPNAIGLNFLRNKIEVTLDRIGAKQSERKVISCWKIIEAKNRSCWPPFELFSLENTKDIRAEVVFLPRLETIDFKGYGKNKNNKLQQFYTVKARNYSKSSGTAILKVTGSKQYALLKANCLLKANSTDNISLNLPTSSGNDKLSLIVTDNESLPFQTVLLENDACLISDAFTEKDYYTGEKTINIKVVFKLSENILKNCEMLIKDKSGNIVKKIGAPPCEVITDIPSEKVAQGKNIWFVSLKGKDGQEYEKRELPIVKLSPDNGKEVKIDRFRRVLLVDGKPFFMYGMLYRPWLYNIYKTPELERTFKLYAETGFNTVINSYYSKTMEDTEWLGNIMALARKYNLKVIDRYCNHRMVLGKNKAYYDKEMKPVFMKDAVTVSKYDNLIGYWNIDEPNLGQWRENLKIAEWYYKDIKRLDPYHPVFALYARNIPPVKAATEWFDIFGYDVYTYPGWKRFSSDIVNFMAYETLQLDEKLKKLHKPIYIMPMPTALDLRRSPLGLTKQEQLAQSYTALIYGAKGLLYFANLYAWGKETSAALKRLGEDIKILQPALLSLVPANKIIYKGKTVNPSKRKFPLVHAGLFRYPDGKYVLLAVNSAEGPVKTSFTINGLVKASRMFEKKTKFSIQKQTFNDELEPLAVRAYGLDIEAKKDSSVEIIIAEKSLPVKNRKQEFIRVALDRVAKKENIVMNPSFEWGQRLQGVPDYYHPQRAAFPEKIGSGEHPFWSLDKTNPYHGKYCFKLTQPAKGFEWSENTLLGRYSCQNLESVTRDYMFSLYLKGQKNGDKVYVASVFAPRKNGKYNRVVAGKTFKLTDNWKRYSFPIQLKSPGAEASAMPLTHGVIKVKPGAGSTIWVDAIQIEKGNKVTEFSD